VFLVKCSHVQQRRLTPANSLATLSCHCTPGGPAGAPGPSRDERLKQLLQLFIYTVVHSNYRSLNSKVLNQDLKEWRTISVTKSADKHFSPCNVSLTSHITHITDKFLRFDELKLWLEEVVSANPSIATVETYGKSHEGRELLLVTITDAATGPHNEKPAHWVDGESLFPEGVCTSI
jgi:hypothetical protein